MHPIPCKTSARDICVMGFGVNLYVPRQIDKAFSVLLDSSSIFEPENLQVLENRSACLLEDGWNGVVLRCSMPFA